MKIKCSFGNVTKRLCAKNAQGRLAVFDSVFLYIVHAFILEFVIEVLSNHSFIDALKFLIFNPFAYLFNTVIIFIPFALCFIIPKRTFFFSLISVLWLGLGVANFVLQFKRVTPLTVVDFTLIPSVAKIFSVYLSVFEIVIIALLIVTVLGLLVFAAIKLKSHKINLLKGGVTLVISALLLALFYNIGIWTSALSTDFNNINIAYADYGFPYCFIVGAFDRGIDEPSEYDEGVINDILDNINSESTVAPSKKPNIVFVQLESFFDVNYLNKLEFSEDPVPCFRKLKNEAISGLLSVPVIGAGTVNTEFEVLTGMNLDFFGAGEYPYKTILRTSTCESTAYNLLELGYKTHAIHNYEGSFYDRNLVYPSLGFQTFTSLEYMNGLTYNASGKWPDDSVLTNEIFTALKSTENPDFVMAVSVQGHGKYPPSELSKDYTEKIQVSFVDGYEGDNLEAYSYYVNQIKEMDDFLSELVNAVNAFDEDTVVVLYGDHLPSLNIENEDLTTSDIFSTEYVIFSNFGLENKSADIGKITTYQLSANVLDLVGISNGVLTKLHQNFSDNGSYNDWLYSLSYDMLYGKRYVYNGNYNYYPKMEMRMGINDIVISSYNYDGSYLYLYGENFTSSSRIVINGKICDDTVFVSENTIYVPYSKSLESISVAQYSATGTRLSQIDEIKIN